MNTNLSQNLIDIFSAQHLLVLAVDLGLSLACFIVAYLLVIKLLDLFDLGDWR